MGLLSLFRRKKRYKVAPSIPGRVQIVDTSNGGKTVPMQPKEGRRVARWMNAQA